MDPALDEVVETKPELTPAQYALLIRETVNPLLRDDYERATFDVRPGVSFADIEIFLGERIDAFRLSQVRNAYRSPSWKEFCAGILVRMRGKLLNSLPAQRRKDDYNLDQVQREIVHQLLGCLSFITPHEKSKLIQDCYAHIKPVFEKSSRQDHFVGEGLSSTGFGKNERWPGSAELRLLAKELTDVIARGFRWSRALTKKSEENAKAG